MSDLMDKYIERAALNMFRELKKRQIRKTYELSKKEK